jgi:hypothetical protein
MVVVTVTALLAGVVLLYSSSTRTQIALSTEKVKLTQVVLRAKSLAISTYSDESVPCGFGLAIDPAARTYSLVRYAAGNCSVLTSVDVTPGNIVPVSNSTYTLPNTLTFDASSPLRYVLFIPPDPRVLLADDSGTLLSGTTGSVTLKSTDKNYQATISFNTAGQVTF